MTSQLWAITSYYNPAGYRNRFENFKSFRAALSVPLIVVEHSPDANFQLTERDADILVQVSGGSSLWQKERLLNIAITHLPANVDYVAWIDCDVIFDHLDWPQQAIKQLQTSKVIQLFSELVDLPSDKSGLNLSTLTYIGTPSLTHLIARGLSPAEALILSHNQPISRMANPGTAWSARRDVVERHGFYDAMILGSGDSAFAHASYGEFTTFINAAKMSESWKAHYLNWALPFHDDVADQIGTLPGRLFHLWHGTISDRRYMTRHKLIENMNFSPDKDLRHAPSGVWEIADHTSDLEQRIRHYFDLRREDGPTDQMSLISH